MRNVKIVYKRFGYSNPVLIVNGENSVLVDTGVKGNLKQIKIWYKQYNLKPEDIKLIILTHTHSDHTGNLHGLKELTGAKVLVHKNEFENLKRGFTPIPKGIGFYPKFVTTIARKLFSNFVSTKPMVADLVNEDEFDLKNYGIDGKVISTPGHSAGSQSVLIGDVLIAGDTFVNMPSGRIFPPFAEEPTVLFRTWEKILNLNVQKIYPAHGKPFSYERIPDEMEKWKTKLKIGDSISTQN